MTGMNKKGEIMQMILKPRLEELRAFYEGFGYVLNFYHDQ